MFRKLLVLILTIIMIACSNQQQQAVDENEPAETKVDIDTNKTLFVEFQVKGMTCEGCENAIVFTDPSLEASVREAINKPTGEIYYEHVSTLFSLNAGGRGIQDLAGIQCLTGLRELSLSHNQISDISILNSLTNLELVYLNNNQISVVSDLSGLTGLIEIFLYDNRISDISGLSGVDPVFLDLNNNQVSDLRPLSGSEFLWYLSMSHNQISDISPLADLTYLSTLYLNDNQISDIRALVDNSGLGNSDDVDITSNNLDCDDQEIMSHISTLEARGVDLSHDCQEPGPGICP